VKSIKVKGKNILRTGIPVFIPFSLLTLNISHISRNEK